MQRKERVRSLDWRLTLAAVVALVALAGWPPFHDRMVPLAGDPPASSRPHAEEGAPPLIPPGETVYLWELERTSPNGGYLRLAAFRAASGERLATLPREAMTSYYPGFSADGESLYVTGQRRTADGKVFTTLDEYDARSARHLRTLYAAPSEGVGLTLLPLSNDQELFLEIRTPDGQRERKKVLRLDRRNGRVVAEADLGRVIPWTRVVGWDGTRFLLVTPLFAVYTPQPTGPELEQRLSILDIRSHRVTAGAAVSTPAGCFTAWEWLRFAEESVWQRLECSREVTRQRFPYEYRESTGNRLRLLDVREGRVVEEIPLPPCGGAPCLTAVSPDGRRLYFIRPLEAPAVIGVDLEQGRTFGQADLAEPETGDREGPPEASLSPRSILAAVRQWWSPVARAKLVSGWTALVSPDGRTLYFTGMRRVEVPRNPEGWSQYDFLRNDGIWVLDAETLQVRGHYLRGREVRGDLTLSRDGRRLYALELDGDGRPTALRILDAGTGRELRAVTYERSQAPEMLVGVGG